MFQVIIPESEIYDEEREEFINTRKETFQIEHSLVSLAKWESKWNLPFLGKTPKTKEQIIDYVRCMTITQNVNPEIYDNIPQPILTDISEYICAPMTATWFSERKDTRANSEAITAEIVYYWMVTHHIPMECQKWHFNRLLTLIRVCNVKNAPPKKMNKKEMLAERRQLNAARRNREGING